MDCLALSVMQPWCGLLALGLKPVENRTWRTAFRGPVLLHAGRTLDAEAMEDLLLGQHPLTGAPLAVDLQSPAFRAGGVVGKARVIDCVTAHDSDWFCGPFAFVLADACVTEFQPCKGVLGFFKPDFSSSYSERPRKQSSSLPLLRNSADDRR